jgi:hypothetical protein
MNQTTAVKPLDKLSDGQKLPQALENAVKNATAKSTSDFPHLPDAKSSYLSPAINWSEGVHQWGLND